MLRKLIKYIKWLREDKPMITYPGYHCGACGRWVDEEFSIPKYKSMGKWDDTWGLCKQCIKECEEDKKKDIKKSVTPKQNTYH